MIYRFGLHELDLYASELRRSGQRLSVEPQVIQLLAVLAGARGRVVTREELIQRVWHGRPVADGTIASRVKSARLAVGDDGASQAVIRTVHGVGYRFIAPSQDLSGPSEQRDGAPELPLPATGGQPGIAVLPFSGASEAGGNAYLAQAIPHELIAAMARLRWLCVTARGSAFRIDPLQPDFEVVGRLLQVRYCLAGHLAIHGHRLVVTLSLVDTRDSHVIWADRFEDRVDNARECIELLLSRTLAALEIRIPEQEARLARSSGNKNLDAWAAYHLGMQEAYRFQRAHRDVATTLFERAIALDPGFARAHAALSFLHFQRAFLRDETHWEQSIRSARHHAERGLELDPLDPFVNFTMGRCHWLEGDVESGLSWLTRSTTLSPHYAHGLYACAWSESMLGLAAAGRQHVDLALRLSPLDPLHYAMLSTRAFTHIHAGEFGEAALWANKAARSPDAHVLIDLIAATTNWLAGDPSQASLWADRARQRQPGITREAFFRSFPMRAKALRGPVSHALLALGY